MCSWQYLIHAPHVYVGNMTLLVYIVAAASPDLASLTSLHYSSALHQTAGVIYYTAGVTRDFMAPLLGPWSYPAWYIIN